MQISKIKDLFLLKCSAYVCVALFIYAYVA